MTYAPAVLRAGRKTRPYPSPWAGRKTRPYPSLFALLVALLLSLALSACAPGRDTGAGDDGGEIGVISGSVTYRERIAMPADAVITVQLLDVTFEDEPEVIAEQWIRPGRQVPIPFTVQYDRSDIDRGGSYALSATIEVEGEVVWRSAPPLRVRLDGNRVAPVEITVTRR